MTKPEALPSSPPASHEPKTPVARLSPSQLEARRRARKRTAFVHSMQLMIVVVFLVAWEELPKIPGITNTFSFMSTFFISSPTLVVRQLGYLVTGGNGATPIWGPLASTLYTALAGTVAALIVGAIGGIAVANWGLLARITRPFLVVVNAIPKVAIIPIIILLVKSQTTSAAVVAFLSVFFLAFYNAAEGASSVPAEMIQNAELLGAQKLRVMLRVRSPYAVAWTLAALPNAIAFGLTATVTVEIISGGSGLGYQLLLGIDNSNANILFAIVFIVSTVGVALVLGAALLRRVLLPWWESSQQQ